MLRLRRLAPAAATVGLVLVQPLAAQQPPPAPDSVARRQQRSLDSLTAALRALQARLDSMARAKSDTGGSDELAALRAAAGAEAAPDSAATGARATPRLGQNALNPEISVTGDLRGYAYHPGPQRDNFVPREFEFAFQSALDPFSVAKVYLSLEDGQISLEEGYVYWTGLPGHLRLDAGQFRQQIGELNRWHLHALPEDEYPLVIRRYVGEEGLAQPGVSLYWPLPFSGKAGTYEWTVQGTAGTNEVLFAGGNRPAILSQLSGFWQFSRSTYGQLSVSGTYGTDPDSGLSTVLGALAARFTWRPPAEATRKEFTVRGELWALRRRYAGAGPTRLGGYAGATWKLSRRWILGVRGDYVQSPEPGPESHEWAVTPSLTFWQSEFVYLRALYERARTVAGTNTDRLTLQAVFAMGPHKHELF